MSLIYDERIPRYSGDDDPDVVAVHTIPHGGGAVVLVCTFTEATRALAYFPDHRAAIRRAIAWADTRRKAHAGTRSQEAQKVSA